MTDFIKVREEMRTFVDKLKALGIEKDEALLILDHLFDSPGVLDDLPFIEGEIVES